MVFSYIFLIAEEEKKCFLLKKKCLLVAVGATPRVGHGPLVPSGSVTLLKNKRRRRKTVRRRDLGALNEFNWP